MEFSHIPVLLSQCLDGLAIDPAGIYLDGTAGGAGHSKEIAKRLTTGRLISLDQDPDAVQTARARLAGLPATVVQINFRYAGQALEQLGIDPKEYAKSYLEGFDYKIGDVTVDEDKGTATAEVTITCKSMNKIVEDFATQYQEKIAALDELPSEDDLYKMAGQVMVDVTKATEPRKTTVIFKYTCNDDGEWSADDSVNSEMMDAMLS